MAENFRPWGQLKWLIGKLPAGDWSFLGTLGTEDRCTSAFSQLKPVVGRQKLLKVIDPHLSQKAQFHQRFEDVESVFINAGVDAGDIIDANLLENTDRISEISEAFRREANGKVILDISSMPKRWFFPIMRFLAQDPDIDDLIVCYSVASRYGDQLSSDPLPLRPLPTFDKPRADASYDDLVVGVGFAPLGMKDLFEKDIKKFVIFSRFHRVRQTISATGSFLGFLKAKLRIGTLEQKIVGKFTRSTFRTHSKLFAGPPTAVIAPVHLRHLDPKLIHLPCVFLLSRLSGQEASLLMCIIRSRSDML